MLTSLPGNTLLNREDYFPLYYRVLNFFRVAVNIFIFYSFIFHYHLMFTIHNKSFCLNANSGIILHTEYIAFIYVFRKWKLLTFSCPSDIPPFKILSLLQVYYFRLEFEYHFSVWNGKCFFFRFSFTNKFFCIWTLADGNNLLQSSE